MDVKKKTYLVVMGGEVEGILIVEERLVVVVCMLRRVFVGAVPVVRQHGGRRGGKPARPLPSVALLEHAARLLQLLRRDLYYITSVVEMRSWNSRMGV